MSCTVHFCFFPEHFNSFPQSANSVQVDSAWVQRVPGAGPTLPPVGRDPGMGVPGGAACPRPRRRQLPPREPHGRHLTARSRGE